MCVEFVFSCDVDSFAAVTCAHESPQFRCLCHSLFCERRSIGTSVLVEPRPRNLAPVVHATTQSFEVLVELTVPSGCHVDLAVLPSSALSRLELTFGQIQIESARIDK